MIFVTESVIRISGICPNYLLGFPLVLTRIEIGISDYSKIMGQDMMSLMDEDVILPLGASIRADLGA